MEYYPAINRNKPLIYTQCDRFQKMCDEKKKADTRVYALHDSIHMKQNRHKQSMREKHTTLVVQWDEWGWRRRVGTDLKSARENFLEGW